MKKDEPFDSWELFSSKLASLRAMIARCRTIKINVAALKSGTREIVQFYFRQARPVLIQTGFTEDSLQPADVEAQELLRLANGNNRKSGYIGSLKRLDEARSWIENEREILLSRQAVSRPSGSQLSVIEQAILNTLQHVVPTAALSYGQAIRDLADSTRTSFRGVASELRECVRETLDHLAPDESVIAQQGFKLEEGQKKPNMKQKAKFILRARGQPSNAIKAPEDSVSIVEDRCAGLARSVYERSSIAAHVTSSRSEVTQMKMYVDTLLAELLEIHRIR